jgi:hypothetical protein
MWLQDGDAKPQLFAPTYATVTRSGSVTSAKRKEGDTGYVTTVGYFYEIQNLNIQRSSKGSEGRYIFSEPYVQLSSCLPIIIRTYMYVTDMKSKILIKIAY